MAEHDAGKSGSDGAPANGSQPAGDGPAPVGGASYDRVFSIDIERELHDSYLTYAMSTIMDRALPDVRDGLKPSQRRILVAMHDLRLSPGKKQIKCAKICGDTSGNYHPHGESVIYPTLVNMGQDWKTRVLLIDKQGNFGSIEGDPPAAMRYTEARMTGATVAMLEDIDKETVDFRSNYDDRLMEPTVLPGKFPNLLVNGSSGIAVGMASSMPPHNLREICRAIVATIDDPAIPIEKLIELVPGPDFPTGGTICGRRGVVEAYATGRGRIVVRGKVHHEKIGEKTSDKSGEKSGGRDVIVIDEVPYQVVQSSLIEKIVEASKSGRIEDISDVQNHSGRDARTRIRVVLKRGADPAVVEKQLYEFTPLQSSFSIINIALVNGQPKTLTLRQLIQCFVDHRKEVVRRRTQFLLRHAKQQAHKLEGLIYAVCDIDEVIRIIRSARTREEAILRLQTRSFRIAADHPRAAVVPQRLLQRASADGAGVMLTRVQAEAIGALRLIQLVGLEIERLASELEVLLDEIDGYELILADERLILDIIKEDCLEIAERFGDDRKTTIEESEVDDFQLEELIQEHQVVVTISHQGYVKRLPVDTYRSQGRGGTGVRHQKSGSEAADDDFVEQLFVSSTHDVLLCFTNTGRVFRMKVWQVPELSRTSRGRAIVNLLELKEGEKIRAFLTITDFEKSEDYLFFATTEGKVKRTSLKDYRNVNRTGIIAINLNEGDQLVGVLQTSGEDHILLASASGKAIRFEENDARVMGRAAAGVKGIELSEGDKVVGLVRCVEGADLLTVTRNGYGKRTPLAEYLVQCEDGTTRPQSRGGLGRIDIQTTERNGPVVDVRVVNDRDSLMFISAGGMLVRVPASEISTIGRNTQGVRVVRLREDDSLIAAATVADGETAESTAATAPPATTDAPPTPSE
ncbi:MAG: DNA gyrase subunit A [Phycisphaerae bacterium]|nr:DNA gyrase subunit A [Phycisphaerae bacterium]